MSVYCSVNFSNTRNRYSEYSKESYSDSKVLPHSALTLNACVCVCVRACACVHGFTSAVRQGEVPGSRAGGGGQAGQGGVALQHVALTAAVADLVADVEGGALLEAVEQHPGVPASVAGQGWGRSREVGRHRERERARERERDKG